MNELDWLKRSFAVRRLSRRELLGRAGAFGITLAAANLWADQLGATEPRKGGVLRFGMSGGSKNDNLNPRTITDGVAGLASYATYNLLVEVDDNANATPELAESWEAKPGAVEWVFNIRKGIAFHNGKELDAEDVVYSLNLHRGDAKSGAKGIVGGIKDIKAADKHQILITLNEPNADLPYTLSDFHLMIVPASWTDWAKPVGTGAFVIDVFEPGVWGAGNRNRNYWKQGRGHADRYEVTVINDFDTRLNALISGQIDLMNRVDRKTVDIINQHNPNLEIVKASGGQHFTFLMLCDRPPFDNLHVRLALKYAIDRDAMVQQILRGFGKVGNDHPIPGHDPFFNTELPIRPYDPDMAKFHLKKAKMESFAVELATSQAAFTEASDTAILYRQQAAKAGIEVDVQAKPFEGYWDNVWMKVPFCMSFWGGRPTADMMLSTAYKSDSDWNDTYWRRPGFDKLLVEARGILDPDRRREMYWDLQEIVHEDGGNIIPMFADFLDCISKKVRGFTPSPVFELSSLRAAERCWLET